MVEAVDESSKFETMECEVGEARRAGFRVAVKDVDCYFFLSNVR